jgi:hypothetical protein
MACLVKRDWLRIGNPQSSGLWHLTLHEIAHFSDYPVYQFGDDYTIKRLGRQVFDLRLVCQRLPVYVQMCTIWTNVQH